MANEEPEETTPAEGSSSEEKGRALYKPQAELRAEGDEGGGAEIGFSKSRRQQYHLQRGRDKEGNLALLRVYHDVPEGFEFDSAGRLKPKEA